MSSKFQHKINPNKLKTRDPFQLAIIKGATKAGIHKNKKKDLNKKACRKKNVTDDNS